MKPWVIAIVAVVALLCLCGGIASCVPASSPVSVHHVYHHDSDSRSKAKKPTKKSTKTTRVSRGRR